MTEAVPRADVTVVVRAARRRVQREHGDVVAAIDRCADEVATAWPADRATDRSAVVEPLRACLDRSGVLEALPSVLDDAVDATGFDLPATPVAHPPYVAITSRGPVLRATIAPGRLVLRFDAFAVVRGPDPGYRRTDGVELVVSLA